MRILGQTDRAGNILLITDEMNIQPALCFLLRRVPLYLYTRFLTLQYQRTA